MVSPYERDHRLRAGVHVPSEGILGGFEQPSFRRHLRVQSWARLAPCDPSGLGVHQVLPLLIESLLKRQLFVRLPWNGLVICFSDRSKVGKPRLLSIAPHDRRVAIFLFLGENRGIGAAEVFTDISCSGFSHPPVYASPTHRWGKNGRVG